MESDSSEDTPIVPVLRVKYGNQWLGVPMLRGERGPQGPVGPAGTKGHLVSVEMSTVAMQITDQAVNRWSENSFRNTVPLGFPAYVEGYARDFVIAMTMNCDPSGQPLPTTTLTVPSGVTVKSYLDSPLVITPARNDVWVFGFTEIAPNVFNVTRKLIH